MNEGEIHSNELWDTAIDIVQSSHTHIMDCFSFLFLYLVMMSGVVSLPSSLFFSFFIMVAFRHHHGQSPQRMLN